ncbi:glycosyltransferase [Altibacter sp. HG106]|uniref:glycosyltransferase n=1 Tax=Altibacter sp. HG106 TaxID=3023937 RepID=UPI0023503A11|nr:glycosyltransferase [Altibacter sp. HG106]MDC7995709.1 glycosyltransferase [Altibacter sp. HG106]
MRIGTNPEKNTEVAQGDFYHQLVIPVYIPEDQGYYKDSFVIFKHCIQSVLKSCHPQTFITLVDNGSMAKVASYIDTLYQEQKIHEVIHTTNVGKINAFFKGIGGHRFSLITIADADVLFLNGWQAASYAIFEAYPKTGFVSTTPNPKLWKYHTGALLWRFFFSNRLTAAPIENPDALRHFASSIGNDRFFKEVHYAKALTLYENGTKAVLGSGHFVATYRGEIFYELQKSYSHLKLGADSVRTFLDAPVANRSMWRLATAQNYTYHMGNTAESWMAETQRTIEPSKEPIPKPKLPPMRKPTWVANLVVRLLGKLSSSSFFQKQFLRQKGFSANERSEY